MNIQEERFQIGNMTLAQARPVVKTLEEKWNGGSLLPTQTEWC